VQKKKKNLAARLYLAFLCAGRYPDQEPAWQAARWYHLLWFLIPIVGFLEFIISIEDAWAKKGERNGRKENYQEAKRAAHLRINRS